MKSTTLGPKRIWNAARYSAHGVRRLWDEPAFRQEVLAAAATVLAMSATGVSAGRMALGAALLLLVFAAEALNTALEVLVDHISPEKSEMAKHAKDLGSAAVGFAILAALGYCWTVAATAALG